MRLRIDPDRCQGHARCFALAPDLFDIDDYGQSSVRSSDPVPPDREDAARLAIANCPEFAIEAIED